MVEITDNPWRADFPALSQTMHGKPLAFLDTAASAQKPQVVLDAIQSAYEYHYANVHRGLYDFSQRKTAEFEVVRGKVAEFIGAESKRNIIFTKNTTEAVNLVAQSWGRTFLKGGDEIILTAMEHHANLVPWHILKNQIGITIKYIPVLDDGTLDMEALPALLTDKTKLVSVTQISNALGTVNDVVRIRQMISAYNANILFMVDGSQAVVHAAVDIQKFAPDFFVFTGHKIYGPTGVGVLYGRMDILDAMPPYQGGGDMIERVTLEGSSFACPPTRFEAGTPAIAEVIGLGASIDYIRAVGLNHITKWESEVGRYLDTQLQNISGIKLYGTAPHKAGISSFTLDGCSPTDVAMILDQMGVAVRTGHHCCQPLMHRFGIDGTIRASIGLYTQKSDIDQLVNAIAKAKKMLG